MTTPTPGNHTSVPHTTASHPNHPVTLHEPTHVVNPAHTVSLAILEIRTAVASKPNANYSQALVLLEQVLPLLG